MVTATSHLERQTGAVGQLQRTVARWRRGGAFLALTMTGASLGLLSLQPQAPVLVWNFTESVPTGLYRISAATPAKGDLVALAPAGATQAVLDAYRVLPAGKVLLKRLSAVAGDTVCRSGVSITINGAEAATARLATPDGHALPVWSGCHVLGSNEILVLAPHPRSFDGRYFGPIDAGQVIGVATPLLTFPLLGAP